MIYADLYTRKNTRVPRGLYWFVTLSFTFSFGIFALLQYTQSNTPTARASLQQMVYNDALNTTANQTRLFAYFTQPVSGYVLYGTSSSQLTEVACKEAAQKTAHILQCDLASLQTGATYWYRLVLQDGVYPAPTEPPFTFQTTQNDTTRVTQPIYGSIRKSSSDMAHIIVPKYHIYGVVEKDGSWIVPVPTNDIDEKLEVFIYSEIYTPTKLSGSLAHYIPVQKVIELGKDILLDEQNVLGIRIAEPTYATTSINTLRSTGVLYPRDGAIIPGDRPLIRGAAKPLSEVRVGISTTPRFLKSVVTSTSGSWRVPVEHAFSPGTYTLTAEYFDNDSSIRRESVVFTIAKSGEQVLGTTTQVVASGPAVITIRPTMIITPIIVSPILSPSISIPSVTDFAMMATPVPQVTYIRSITVDGTSPGVIDDTITLSVIGVGSLLSSMAFFLFAKQKSRNIVRE